MNKFVNSYVVFDTETTGLKDQTDRIIEIGALKYINDELVDEFDVLINPETDIPEIITTITGITNEMVKDAKKIDEVLPLFMEFVGDLPVICHNAPFDIGFINASLRKCHMESMTNHTIDTVLLAKEYIPQAYNYKLETLKKYFKLDYGSHRSVDDCRTTNFVYQECKKRALETVF
jgi:DNA polymerase III epsilon subunit family exonuclease